MADARRQRVALLYGGRSSEHAVSCVSAGSVLAALDREVWDVVAVGITADGRWVLEDGDPDALRIDGGVLPVVAGTGRAVTISTDPTQPGLRVEGDAELTPIDVVFPLLHGPYGEDGTVQGLLELAGLPYVGSGVLASASSMDKASMKLMLIGAGLPVGPYVVVEPRAWETAREAELTRVVAELEFPVFVKPARGGSSLGISKVEDDSTLAAAIDLARRHDPKVVVEQAMPGREIECGVLSGSGRAGSNGDAPRASLPAEVRVHPDHAFYDFEAKYIDGADLDVPANLTAAETAAIQALAVRGFEAMGCEGLARVDFFLCEDGTLVINEVNTMPGFTPSSMFPQMWGATGVTYAELVDALLRAALARPLGLR